MAATRLIALHKNKGKSVAACLKSRTDYAKNPDKTNRGELVSSYECSPLTADEEFMLSKRQYELATGRRQKNDVIAYQIRQSFRPGEITAEEANKVGYELAMRFTKGKYVVILKDASNLLLSMPQQTHFERLKNNLPIYPEAALFDILHVQIHPFLKREVIAVRGDLPIAAQTGCYIQALLFVVAVLFHLAGKCRAGANDAHIALQDVPKLRQLVEAGLADKLAHAGNAGVILDLEHRAVHLVLFQQIVQFCLCVGAHRAELVELKRLTISSNTLLRENRASRRVIKHEYNESGNRATSPANRV